MKLALQTAGFNPPGAGAGSGELRIAETLVKIGAKTALDVGANIGNYSQMLLRAGFEQVDAFEPHPDSFQSLCEVSRVSQGKLVAHQLALGEFRGEATLNFDIGALNLASLDPRASNVPYVHYSDSLDVEVSTIRVRD